MTQPIDQVLGCVFLVCIECAGRLKRLVRVCSFDVGSLEYPLPGVDHLEWIDWLIGVVLPSCAGCIVVIIKVFGAEEKFELDAEDECAVNDDA